jgi:hypothetical protein
MTENDKDKNTEKSGGIPGGDSSIAISEEMKKRLPEDFDVSDIGRIDLKEAEDVARDDTLFLTEKDLIEGLEDFELIPLDDDEKTASTGSESDHPVSVAPGKSGEEEYEPVMEEEMDEFSSMTSSPEATTPDEPTAEGESGRPSPPGESSYPEEKTYDESLVMLDEDEDGDGGSILLQDEEDFVLQDEGEVPDRTGETAGESEAADKIEDEGSIEPVTHVMEETGEEVSHEESDTGDLLTPSDEDELISDIIEEVVYDGELEEEEKETTGEDARVQDTVPAEVQESGKEGDESLDVVLDSEKFYSDSQEAETSAGIPEVFSETASEEPVDRESWERSEPVQHVPGEPAEGKETGEGEAGEEESYEEPDYIPEPAPDAPSEVLPDSLYGVASDRENAYIIDDNLVEGVGAEGPAALYTGELDRVTVHLSETAEGEPVILNEVDREEDRDRIAFAPVESIAGYDDLYLDFEDEEIKYRDDELEFIHSAIIDEDYSRYLRQIDVYHGLRKEKSITSAIEIMGLTFNELESIEDKLIGEEYSHVDLESMAGLFRPAGEDRIVRGISRECNYLIPSEDSLLDSEKESIENDIDSNWAIIWEEDVDQLQSELEALGVDIRPENIQIVDTVYNITDRVVILEEEDDVDRFIDQFPEQKQEDLARLLKYLDGLFEKLPESTVKKFAESEYFDLYVNLLNDLGV